MRSIMAYDSTGRMVKFCKGSVIREHKYGRCAESTITSDVIQERGKLVFKSKTDSGAEINYRKYSESLEWVRQQKPSPHG